MSYDIVQLTRDLIDQNNLFNYPFNNHNNCDSSVDSYDLLKFSDIGCQLYFPSTIKSSNTNIQSFDTKIITITQIFAIYFEFLMTTIIDKMNENGSKILKTLINDDINNEYQFVLGFAMSNMFCKSYKQRSALLQAINMATINNNKVANVVSTQRVVIISTCLAVSIFDKFWNNNISPITDNDDEKCTGTHDPELIFDCNHDSLSIYQ